MKSYRVGVVGATGMVGQRFLSLLENHPWFKVELLAASGRSANKTYEEALNGRWALEEPLPTCYKDKTVLDATADFNKIVDSIDFIFCAVDMDKQATLELEERYARAGVGVVSNNSAHRLTPDVPMIIPELNPGHAQVIEHQRKRLATETGFISVKSNCSIQSYLPLFFPLLGFKPTKAAVSTYQAISGAGKTFSTWPEMIDNVIPYIGGEDEKSEQEPLKVLGRIENGGIVNAPAPVITAQCVRVPVIDGHMASVFVSFEKKPGAQEIIELWESFKGRPQELGLPSAPKQFIHYFRENDRPQTKTERMLENGMAISAGRLRADSVFDYKFIGLSHNTLRGAAGGAVLMAELLAADGYIVKR